MRAEFSVRIFYANDLGEEVEVSLDVRNNNRYFKYYSSFLPLIYLILLNHKRTY